MLPVSELLPRGTETRSLGTRLSGWFERHVQTLLASLGRLARAPSLHDALLWNKLMNGCPDFW